MAAAVQSAVRKKGQSSCVHHNGKTVEFLCEKCNELACKKCVASCHRGHELTELDDIAEQQKIIMISFIDEVENNKLPNIKENICSVDKQIESTSEYFDTLGAKVQEQGVKMKHEIDVMIAESLSLYQKLKEDNIRLLTDYKQCLEDGHEGLKEQLHECKTQLQDASVIELHDAGHAFRTIALNLPDIPNLHTAVFEAPTHYRCYLEQALGTITTNALSECQRESIPQLPSPKRESTTATPVSGATALNRPAVTYTFLPQTSIMGKFQTNRIGNKICPTGSDEIWISYSDVLELLNKKGVMRRQFKFTVRITDISISPRTRNIWVCSDADSSIMECTQGAPSLRFHCKNKPICLCVTIGNQILVGMSQRVTKFSQQGKSLLRTQTQSSGRSLVRLPQKIAECRLTQNVAVVERQSYDANCKSQVLVMDKEFGELFRYRGDGQQAAGAVFDPWDVTFDNAGNLLIADCNNHSVLLVSSVGEFIRTVFTDERSTQAICLNKNHVLWAVFGDVVKRLQYYSA
ncbi:E3 ubiquitin-protein ligase TRIM71-like [Mizuhopecten yessoensis]|uniref:E3 ubiquitin-protein ligase TRIM71-like n=1 Tax=Mizuhopecten yessoensis TaxID=6573 RepID=UPI000B4595C5|nr:E3 ubiquitin-protein ligase TRIM71-like [Mizuhopecten yessoensis]